MKFVKIVAIIIRLRNSTETLKHNANIEYHQAGDSQALHSSRIKFHGII